MNDEDLERLFAQFRPYLKSLVGAGLPRDLQAKLDPSDVVQETLLRGYREFHDYRGQSEHVLRAWLEAILRNYLADVRRSYRSGIRDTRRESPLEDVACPYSVTISDSLDQVELTAQLRVVIGGLPSDYRQVIELRQFEGLEFDEIGRQMNRSADAARIMWARAVLLLGKRLNRVK